MHVFGTKSSTDGSTSESFGLGLGSDFGSIFGWGLGFDWRFSCSLGYGLRTHCERHGTKVSVAEGGGGIPPCLAASTAGLELTLEVVFVVVLGELVVLVSVLASGSALIIVSPASSKILRKPY